MWSADHSITTRLAKASMKYPALSVGLIISGILGLPCNVHAQAWSEPRRFDSLAGIEFRSRNSPTDTATVGHFMEWAFSNNTNSPVGLEYVITSNRGETREGWIYLKARQNKLSGWYFDGDKILDVIIDTVLS